MPTLGSPCLCRAEPGPVHAKYAPWPTVPTHTTGHRHARSFRGHSAFHDTMLEPESPLAAMQTPQTPGDDQGGPQTGHLEILGSGASANLKLRTRAPQHVPRLMNKWERNDGNKSPKTAWGESSGLHSPLTSPNHIYGELIDVTPKALNFFLVWQTSRPTVAS